MLLSLPVPICMGNHFLSISTHTRGRHLTQPGANSNLQCPHTGKEAEVPFRALVVSWICLFTARTRLLHNVIPADFPVLPSRSNQRAASGEHLAEGG